MTQKTKSRIVIDTNKHGIRRETNLDKVASRSAKKKKWEKDPHWKKKKESKLSTELSTDSDKLSTDSDISIVRSRNASVNGEINIKRGN